MPDMRTIAETANGFGGAMGHALRIGFRSARANLVPMVVLWLLATAAVFAYYFVPGATALFEPLARWQRSSGWLAAFLNRFVFCGALPGVFVLTLPELRPARFPILTVAATGLWGGVWGILTDGFFRLQGVWFGVEPTVGSIVMRTLVDQFVWNVFVVTPCVATFYYWIACGFSVRRLRLTWPEKWIVRVILPNLVTNWCVWIPVVAAVYAFPVPLQIQVSGFASAFWTLVCLKIGSGCAANEKTRGE